MTIRLRPATSMSNLDCFYCPSCQLSHPSSVRCRADRVELITNVGNVGAMRLGTVLVTERMDPVPSKEVDNLNMLRTHLGLLVPAGVCAWVEKNGAQFSVVSRVRGITLAQVWRFMTSYARRRIARQTGMTIAKLRALTSDRAMRLGGEPLYNGHLFKTRGTGYGIPHGPLETDDEVWREMLPGLDGRSDEDKARLRALMPSSGPFTFTHGGLTMENIIVDGDGQLVAIVGWEYAGYFPVWWEHVALRRSGVSSDPEATTAGVAWRSLLLSEMPWYEEGWAFWSAYNTLCERLWWEA